MSQDSEVPTVGSEVDGRPAGWFGPGSAPGQAAV
jgi:hypothetical protein